MREDSGIDELAQRAGALQVGDIVVRRAHITTGKDSTDSDALFASLVVDDPTGQTWPSPDVTALDVAVNAIAAELGRDEYVFVSLTATSEAEADTTSASSVAAP